MNRINVFNEIVAYIEAHLDTAIDIGLLARKCGLSVYEFRRIFSFAAGIPVNEYIRKRRLSRAGEELLRGDTSVTALAAKYGYDAPSSFSRAFKEFHGVSPVEAAKGDCALVLFSPLGFEAKMCGGTQSAYRLKKDTAFTVCGLSQVSEITDSECCEDAWSAFYASDSADELLKACKNQLYAVYENGENSVRCHIGARGYEAPLLAHVRVPEALWMCFSFHGSEDRKVNAFYKTLFDCLAASRYEKDETRPNIEIFPENMDDKRLCAVICTDVLTGEKTKYKAKLFADCSGDAVLSRLAGAEVMYGREAQSVFGESLAPKEHQKLVMGHSIRWYTEKTDVPSDFPDIGWGLALDDTTYLNVYNGDWEQETGFARDMADDIEYIRDYGLRAIYSNWSYQKNHCKNKADFACYRLKWASALGGKRESYRVVGDYVLTQRDIEEKTYHEDGTACLSWSIDMHFPEPDNAAAFGEAFRSFAYHRGIVSPYPVPYRCLYARDVENLFLGGRTVSTSHVAFSSVRVMRTLGMLGEVVGLAAGICREKACLPREVYTKYLPELQARMKKGVPIPCAFEGLTNAEEAYHFKDAGWFSLDHPENSERHDPAALRKLKKGIAALGLPHKYPLPKEFTEEDTEE